MGAAAARLRVAGELMMAAAMDQLRGNLAPDIYDSWLKGAAEGAEAVGVIALMTAEASGGGAVVLAPETGGASLAVGGVVSAGALTVAGNAGIVTAMAMSDIGKGTGPAGTPRVDVSSGGVTEGTGVTWGKAAPERAKAESAPPSVSRGGSSQQSKFKTAKEGLTDKEAAKDAPSWARNMGERPKAGESGKDFARRILDKKYGEGGWKDTGPKSEGNQVKKWADRSFEERQ